MIEVPRPEQPAGGTTPAGRRRSPARQRGRVRRKARQGIGATTALVVMATGGTMMTMTGTATAAGSTKKASSSPTTTPRQTTRPFTVTGVLVSVGAKSLAFRLADETVATATLTSKTVFTKSENLKPSALTNGKQVTVVGTTTDGVLAASRIVVLPAGSRLGAGGFAGFGGGVRRGSLPEGFRPRNGEGFRPREGFRPGEGFAGGGNIAVGTISGLSGGSFTLTSFNKTKEKVTTTASTAVTETVRTNKKGLTVGQQLLISGKEVNNTTVAAATVSQGTAGFGGFGRGAGGPGGAGRPGASGGGIPPTT
jgi:Domain of unknown function (DUF5666)